MCLKKDENTGCKLVGPAVVTFASALPMKEEPKIKSTSIGIRRIVLVLFILKIIGRLLLMVIS